MPDPITTAAVGWGVSAVGWVASPIVSRLLNKGFEYLGFDASKKLTQLEPKVLLLEQVMEVVDESSYRPRLELLLKDLKSAFYEAEDILDDLEYHRLKRRIQDDKLESDGAPRPQRDQMKKVWSAVATKFSPLKNKETGMSNNKLIQSLKKIEDIIVEAHQILDRLNLSNISNSNRKQIIAANSRTPSASPHEVIGRDDDRDKIIAMLHEKEGDGQPSTSSSLCYSVIGIHGIGGSGKSTLAQFVCAQERKNKQYNKDGHFDLVIWVHVSQKFTMEAIFRNMIEAATENPCPQLNNPDIIQKKLEEILCDKRFLVVLDDVWCNKDVDEQNLPQLLSPLKVGRRGSKILVTTRNEYALSDLGPDVRYTAFPVPDFDDTVFFELFMYYALRDRQDRSMLHDIGAEIAKKLKGSPLAAATVGGQLRKKQDVEYWRTVRDQDLLNGTMGALWWSYQHLGEQVRRCFAYCSIFPRRNRLYRDDLVNLWVAEGFIGSTANEGKEMEDVGREYFDELASISFLKPGGKDFEFDLDGKVYYLVHDLLHDLAKTVAGSDCFSIENNSELSWAAEGLTRRIPWTRKVPADVRHLFVQYYDGALITEKILQLENLRTLIINTADWGMPVEVKVIESMFRRLRKLRVLAVCFHRQHDPLVLTPNKLSVPESISQCKHLRYLAFRKGILWSVTLPSTLTKLYYMQVLDFGRCSVLKFPSSDLINLRHVGGWVNLKLPDISRLISLQTIPYFTVQKEQGYEVRQLRDLNKLQGTLEIRGLENLGSKEEALEANLAAKERLAVLSLYWGSDTRCSPEAEAEVLEGLCPHMGLQTLCIWYYEGLTYPTWMVSKQNNERKYLHHLELHGCGQLGPAPELEAFIQLRSLLLRDCSWDTLPCNIEHLTSLERLMIFQCLNIQSLPTLPKSLKEFKLVGCNDEFMKSCQTIGHPNWQNIEHIPNKFLDVPDDLHGKAFERGLGFGFR